MQALWGYEAHDEGACGWCGRFPTRSIGISNETEIKEACKLAQAVNWQPSSTTATSGWPRARLGAGVGHVAEHESQIANRPGGPLWGATAESLGRAPSITRSQPDQLAPRSFLLYFKTELWIFNVYFSGSLLCKVKIYFKKQSISCYIMFNILIWPCVEILVLCVYWYFAYTHTHIKN